MHEVEGRYIGNVSMNWEASQVTLNPWRVYQVLSSFSEKISPKKQKANIPLVEALKTLRCISQFLLCILSKPLFVPRCKKMKEKLTLEKNAHDQLETGFMDFYFKPDKV